MTDTKTTTVFTTAPQAADYSRAKQIETFTLPPSHEGARVPTWRKVEITADPYRTGYQCDRYRSFLGGVAIVEDPREKTWFECAQAPSNY